jgi:hypothetical protein
VRWRVCRCDNCPTVAGAQTNSDGDPLGDVCDNCPHTDNVSACSQ